MKPALIIVDMQYDFEASHCQRTIRNVIKLVEQFKSQNLPIFVVEYEGHGDTQSDIIDALAGYEWGFGVLKCYDNGADEIIETAIQNGIDFDSCVVCGVNYDCCVYSTGQGLTQDHFKVVTIAENACNTPYKKTIQAWEDFREEYLLHWAKVEVDEAIEEKSCID